ncbi:hypothetical protein C2S52_021779 [Perilla frutescens var. hirtella]|uniref:Uncharacterized protein n=1 Tax=Perilla frutescens var. hirtella TaxID=608512 RepID=A0AAD4NZR4_PERFH|nr:hypothetical protein C2S52_021779 [Perilla frutescens var. hirtella]KAH6799164.1 hypothetical protein C2S51_035648 [Perilla frutescens var. frutescens]KAH6807683.1 hypothetical protein C2S51_028791 [Perilla frutescens var. frutescens]KAH6820707.1 hypothetical protein C2S53_003402 [Perilla frutescens var. hirtella]
MVWVVLASASMMSVIIWKCAEGGRHKEAGSNDSAVDVYGGSGCAAACGAGCGA